MPAKRCSRKTTTKRKSVTKKKTPCRRKSTATCRRRKSTSTCRRRASSTCRQPYLRTAGGYCGTVPCVDPDGNPLAGHVRGADGTCAPRKCPAGYVFNYATGNCVTKNSYQGQELINVKRYNDAQLALEKAQKVLNNRPTSAVAIYNDMLGGSEQISAVQARYRKALAEQNLKMQAEVQRRAERQREVIEKAALLKNYYPEPQRQTVFSQFFG